MSIISRAADLFYAFRFLKLLITPWEKTEAFKLGIVDETGKTIKKGSELKTPEEKSAYTVFHRLVFNIKRLMNLLPLGKTQLGSWATALFLIKEETGMSEERILETLKKMEIDFDNYLFESTWYMGESDKLQPGTYTLMNDVISPTTGEIINLKNTKVLIPEDCYPVGNIIGTPIYEVYHIKTKLKLYINPREIGR